jgi:hypothetical protein
VLNRIIAVKTSGKRIVWPTEKGQAKAKIFLGKNYFYSGIEFRIGKFIAGIY